MPDSFEPIAEILVPMDFSDCSVRALEFAKRIATASDARIHLLYVDDDPLLIQPSTAQSFRDEHEDKMAMKFIDLLPPDQRQRFRTVMAIRSGSAYYEIVTYAAERAIELIVMGCVGRTAIANLMLGSVATRVIQHATCAVLTVKNR